MSGTPSQQQYITIGWDESSTTADTKRQRRQGGKEGPFEFEFAFRRRRFDSLAAKGCDHIVVPSIDYNNRVVRLFGLFRPSRNSSDAGHRSPGNDYSKDDAVVCFYLFFRDSKIVKKLDPTTYYCTTNSMYVWNNGSLHESVENDIYLFSKEIP